MPIRMHFEEQIAAPPERVFQALTDVEAAKAWMPNLVSIEWVEQRAEGVGSQFRETRRMFGREATEHFEVAALEPNRMVELYVDGTKGTSGKGWYRFRYHLEPSGGGIRLRLDGEMGGMGRIGELIGRLFVGMFKKAIARDMQAMKRHLERGA